MTMCYVPFDCWTLDAFRLHCMLQYAPQEWLFYALGAPDGVPCFPKPVELPSVFAGENILQRTSLLMLGSIHDTAMLYNEANDKMYSPLVLLVVQLSAVKHHV